ncbi:hypothetical protein DP116_25220 [Brasilonema bromeliae SPC951]|uniref:Uncharacterized protein n=1 Tax=Brasilonema bromeliae SPC951 TaxID=385972 RepID=A0ABX1PFD4_9CYAN|nr:hypothetical protein [Brasilonema bromeliae SPC951]
MIPNARLVEAGGTSSGSCALRVASFTTDLPLQTALDWYYTRATDAGYTAEHQAEGDDHVLGGTRARDDAAYVVFLKPAKQGGTAIELIANRGA